MGNPAPTAHQKMRHWQRACLGVGPVPAPELCIALLADQSAARCHHLGSLAGLLRREKINIIHHATALRARRLGAD